MVVKSNSLSVSGDDIGIGSALLLFLFIGIPALFFVAEDAHRMFSRVTGEHQCRRYVCFRQDTEIRVQTRDSVREFWYCPEHRPVTGYASRWTGFASMFFRVIYWLLGLGMLRMVIVTLASKLKSS